MAQIFHPSTNTISKVSIFGSLFFLGAIAWTLYTIDLSPYATEATVTRDQPVQFSHKHHVSGLGIDCRYCHTSVEESSFAGMPPTKTCITCHSQIWAESPFLEPVRASFRENKPIQWIKIYDLPDFVYFDHSIHIYKGVACVTCHGHVEEMPLTYRQESLHMTWCLGCHREPERYIRPREHVFDMDWTPKVDQLALGQQLLKEYSIQKLTDCWTCHR
jgi:hypothetical protein